MSLRLVYYTKSKQKKQALFSKKMKKFRKYMKLNVPPKKKFANAEGLFLAAYTALWYTDTVKWG